MPLGKAEFDNFGAAYVYFVIILNISQLWAMYCLVFVYQYVLSSSNTHDVYSLTPPQRAGF